MRPLENRLALMISEADEFSKCGICYRLPTTTLVLDCYHSYCLDCLRTYRANRNLGDRIPCPLCGSETHIMDGLRRNSNVCPVQSPEVGQAPFACDLCVDARTAEGMCLDCSEKLCKFCLESHQNSKASKHHRIKIFGERIDCVQHVLRPDEIQVHVNNDRDAEAASIKCIAHPEEDLTHFCRMCTIPVCKQCRQSPDHKGHRTRPLAAAMSDKRRTLSQRAQRVKDGYVEVLSKKLHNSRKRQDQIRENSREVIEETLLRAELLKRDIDIACDKVIGDVKESEKASIEQIQQFQNSLDGEILTVGGFLQNLKNILNVGDDLEMARSLKSWLPALEDYEKGRFDERIERTRIEFERGELTADVIRKGFGNITVKNHGPKWSRSVSVGAGVSQEVNVRVTSVFDCPSLVIEGESDQEDENDPVHAIAPTSENEAWTTSGWESTHVVLVDANGEMMNTVNVKSRIDDLAINSENEVLVTCFREKCIKKMSENGEIIDTIQTSFYPRGIAATEDGGFLVCMTDDYSTSLASDSRRLVTKYSRTGNIDSTFELNQDSRLFRRPYRIAENINNDICVSDRTSMGSGRVVVLDNNGNLKFIYEGPTNNQCQRKFAPAGITCDSFGQILVADTNNHCIHILDRSGQFLGFLLKPEDGITSPHSLAFDGKGFFWVGDELGSIRVFEYIL